MKELINLIAMIFVLLAIGIMCMQSDETDRLRIELSNLSDLKSKDSTLQAKYNDSLRQLIYERRNKL